MATCKICGNCSNEVATALSLCAECIQDAADVCLPQIRDIHRRSREQFGLPGSPPAGPDGVRCSLCENSCRIPAGQTGYCGIRHNDGGRLKGGTPEGAAVSWYYDPLPTNCVADWVCAEGSGTRHPGGRERGAVNLAVFYEACTFDCLFCQNWHYRQGSAQDTTRSAAELADSVTANTACICFFGGDPTCQLPHALAASKLAREENPLRTLRICWETNGSMDPKLLGRMMTFSLDSGGCVKFDLKAMDKAIHYALCGVDNSRTLENFTAGAERIPERPDPPPLIASTLLVPGYVDAEEVGSIASFVAELDPEIPYALLGFHGDFLLTDLPSTSLEQAERCLEAAEAAGLKRVRLGNVHIFR
ncbi:MAG: radical SAM protein [Phycisphaerales bacterium]|nr:MAG: radical SAM protein [Phycisphaerales bacterium]